MGPPAAVAQEILFCDHTGGDVGLQTAGHGLPPMGADAGSADSMAAAAAAAQAAKGRLNSVAVVGQPWGPFGFPQLRAVW